ncbi:MAG: capsular biosynthesis protein [Acidobacteriota bacterium]
MRYLVTLLLLTLPALAQDRLYPFAVDQDKLGGAVDFSSLNRPLTPADRLFVRGEHFYRVGADLKPNTKDDERVPLFGTNMVFGASFPEEADAGRIAKRLRRLGINLARLHHMDTSPDRDPKEARSILTQDPYPTLNPVSTPRLRKLLDAFRAEGVYVNVNLHVGYVFRPAVDGVPEMPEGQSIPTHSKPLHIFHPRMVELQLEFTRKVLGALNLKKDPVLGMVEINNETSLVEAWQRGNLDRYALGAYKAELEKQWNAFLRTKYRATEALAKAWGAPPADPVPLVSRQEEGPVQRINDYLLFLAERDRSYLRRMRDAVREATDLWMPVAGTQMGYGGLLNLDTHAVLDYQDNHFYIDHYNFPNRAWDARDWRIRDSSSVGSGLATFLNMAAAREAGRPYTVSEFNQPWPNRQAAENVPTLAAFAAFQDWDSIMHFAYSHSRNWEARVPSGFDLNSDWTKYVNFGQSAWLFRTGAVERANKAVEMAVSEEVRLRAARERRIGAVAAALQAATGYDPNIALIHRVGLRRREGAASPALAAPAAPFRSDTGELIYDRDAKVLTLQTPTAAGVFGFIGTRKTAAGAIDVELAPGARGFATILVTALDRQPIKESKRLLLTAPGYTLGTQPGADPARPQRLVPYGSAADWFTIEPEPDSGRPSGNRSGGIAPVWMERVESYVTLRSAGKRVTVYPLDGAGARLAALGAEALQPVSRGGFRIHLQGDGQPLAPWYELVVE